MKVCLMLWSRKSVGWWRRSCICFSCRLSAGCWWRACCSGVKWSLWTSARRGGWSCTLCWAGVRKILWFMFCLINLPLMHCVCIGFVFLRAAGCYSCCNLGSHFGSVQSTAVLLAEHSVARYLGFCRACALCFGCKYVTSAQFLEWVCECLCQNNCPNGAVWIYAVQF